MVIADALLTYTRKEPDRSLTLHQRFVELDRATTPVQALAQKLARYSTLHQYIPPLPQKPDTNPGVETGLPAWRAHYPEFPGVLVAFVAPERTKPDQREHDRENLKRRMQHTIALHAANATAHDITVLLVLLEDLKARGPYAPIFIDPREPGHYQDWLDQAQHRAGART